MIHTSKQLKDKVRNISKGDNDIAKVLIRTFMMERFLERAITPTAIEYEYKLMFEDRMISLLWYNTETLLAEKIQTILSRGIANTRMRDFYDVYGIIGIKEDKIDKEILLEAFKATCEKRETVFTIEEITTTLNKISENDAIAQMWEQFRKKNFFVGDLTWTEVSASVISKMKQYIIM